MGIFKLSSKPKSSNSEGPLLLVSCPLGGEVDARYVYHSRAGRIRGEANYGNLRFESGQADAIVCYCVGMPLGRIFMDDATLQREWVTLLGCPYVHKYIPEDPPIPWIAPPNC